MIGIEGEARLGLASPYSFKADHRPVDIGPVWNITLLAI